MILTTKSISSSPGDWEVLEDVAEKYPFVVALLDATNGYVCSGTVIDTRTVLTSGTCLESNPHYVAVGAALFHNNEDNDNTFKIAYTRLHRDYVFDARDEQTVTRMHSNVAIVIIMHAVLENYFEGAAIGNLFASELEDKEFTVVGYGKLRHSLAIVLQRQAYRQIACSNPKWYYCTCGMEYSEFVTYEDTFGEGAPVLFDDEVVGIAVRPCGLLTLRKYGNYNIFTILAPYLQWIEKTKSDSLEMLRSQMTSGAEPKLCYFVTIISFIVHLIYES